MNQLRKASSLKGTPFDRTGQKPAYLTEVAAKLNWLRRMTMGAIGSMRAHHNFYWIRAHDNWEREITPERKLQLSVIETRADIARKALEDVRDAIERYYTLPTVSKPSKGRSISPGKPSSALTSD